MGEKKNDWRLWRWICKNSDLSAIQLPCKVKSSQSRTHISVWTEIRKWPCKHHLNSQDRENGKIGLEKKKILSCHLIVSRSVMMAAMYHFVAVSLRLWQLTAVITVTVQLRVALFPVELFCAAEPLNLWTGSLTEGECHLQLYRWSGFGCWTRLKFLPQH